MKAVVLFISLLLLAAITLAQDESEVQCMDGSETFKWESEDKMDHCCWYYEESCCDPAMLGTMDPIADKVTLFVYNLLTDEGKNTNSTIEKCFTYLENFFCFPCSPNSASFAQLTEETLTVTICEDFCNDFYDACNVDSLPGVQTYFSNRNITTGSGLCTSLPALLSPLLETPSSSSPSPSPSSPLPSPTEIASGDETPSVQPSEEETPSESPSAPPPEPTSGTETSGNTTEPGVSKVFALPQVIVVVSSGDSDCYEGVSSSTVGKSSCTYWDGKDYDEDSDSFWWYWVFFVLAAIVIIVILIVIAIVAGVIIYKKRFATQVVTSNTGDYPNLDELEE